MYIFMQVIADKLSNNRILGIHYTGPNAGEVMQGYAVAMRLVFC
jgi:pyruvate/2-oxoglutarate dehydrogenase complex dihydrolipoamide dehydrogenase (E3) component